MADFNALEALINAHIKKNGVQAITGNILNGILRGMVSALGKGYTIAGVAVPSSDPGTMTGPLAYLAYTAGTYTHFGGLEVGQGEVSMLIYNEAEWHKEVLFVLSATATVDDNVGTPEVGVSFVDGLLTFDFRNMKGNPGNDGDAAGFGTINATVDGNVGTPGVSVQSSGPDTAKNITFQFTNLKGETGVTSVVATVDNTVGTPTCTVSLVGQQLTLAFSGLKGAQGDTGSSVDYPFTIVNNLTTNDATQALSAAMGVQLEAEVSQLEAKVGEIEKQDGTDEDNALEIKNDAGTETILRVTDEGVEAKNLKTNGENVATENEVNTKQDKIDEIKFGERQDVSDYQSWENNDGTEIYARIDRNGIFAKDYRYNDGEKEVSLVPIIRSASVSVSAPFANIYNLMKPFEGKEITIRCTSASMLGKYQIIFVVNGNYVYGNLNTFKGYWSHIRVPENISDCMAYVNYFDDEVRVEIEELSFNKFAHIIVGKTEIGARVYFNYSSVLEGVMMASKYESSLVEILPGVYDLTEEFTDLYGDDFFTDWAENDDHSQPYYVPGIMLSNRVNIKGSPDSKISFIYSGNNSSVRSSFGPFRASRNGFTMDGVTIESANCRYSVHDERGSEEDFYRNTYKNCRMSHDNTDGVNSGLYHQCIGGGLGLNGLIQIEGCHFDSAGFSSTPGGAVSYHNSAGNGAKNRLFVRDNFVAGKGTFRFSYYGTSTKMTNIIACGNNIGSAIVLNAEGGSSNVNCELKEWNNIVRS